MSQEVPVEVEAMKVQLQQIQTSDPATNRSDSVCLFPGVPDTRSLLWDLIHFRYLNGFPCSVSYPVMVYLLISVRGIPLDWPNVSQWDSLNLLGLFSWQSQVQVICSFWRSFGCTFGNGYAVCDHPKLCHLATLDRLILVWTCRDSLSSVNWESLLWTVYNMDLLLFTLHTVNAN